MYCIQTPWHTHTHTHSRTHARTRTHTHKHNKNWEEELEKRECCTLSTMSDIQPFLRYSVKNSELVIPKRYICSSLSCVTSRNTRYHIIVYERSDTASGEDVNYWLCHQRGSIYNQYRHPDDTSVLYTEAFLCSLKTYSELKLKKATFNPVWQVENINNWHKTRMYFNCNATYIRSTIIIFHR